MPVEEEIDEEGPTPESIHEAEIIKTPCDVTTVHKR